MDERPEQPPEGKLIAEALKRSGLSIRKASKQAGISYGRWRQITSGYQNVSPGSYARVTAPADTLARMAAAVSVTPEQLEDAGRPDAAGSLRSGAPMAAKSARGVSAAEEDLILQAAEVLRRGRKVPPDPEEDPESGLSLARREHPGLVLSAKDVELIEQIWITPGQYLSLQVKENLTRVIADKAARGGAGEAANGSLRPA